MWWSLRNWCGSKDLSRMRIPLQRTNIKKWGRGPGGQIHTAHFKLSIQTSSWCLSFTGMQQRSIWSSVKLLFTFVSNSLSYIPILRKKIQTKDKIEPQHIHRQITDNNVFFGFLNYFGLYGKEEGLKILETNLTRVE